MKTEEKIRGILNRHYGHEVMAGSDLWFTKQYQDRYAHLLEMAEWKDKQFAEMKKQLIEKACEWLGDNYPYYFETDIEEQFKKAMEE